MAVRNSYGSGTLKFDDTMGVLRSEEVRRKSSRSAEVSKSAPSIDRRERSGNKDKKRMRD